MTLLAKRDSRPELEEALRNLSTTAGRMLRFDHLGKPNILWANCHRQINDRLDEWQAAK